MEKDLNFEVLKNASACGEMARHEPS